MKRFVLIMISLQLFIVGCSNNKQLEPNSTPNTNLSSEQVQPPEQQDQALINNQNPDKNNPGEAERNDDEEIEKKLTEELKTYLYENFGGAGNPEFATSWYKYIDNVRINVYEDELEVTIYTSIYPDDEGKEYAEKFFPPIWGWANRATDPKNVTFVKVMGQNNRVLASQTNPLY